MKTHSFAWRRVGFHKPAFLRMHQNEIEKENGFYEKIIWNSKRNR